MEENNDMLEDKEPTKKKKKKVEKKGLKYELLDLLKTFVICFIAVFLVTTFIVKPIRVDGKSMTPTLLDNEIGLMNVFKAKYSSINRFDVVVVYNEEEDQDWVKRVIGLPGDTVYAKDDVVYVNGKAIDEPYLDNDYANGIRKSGLPFTEDFEKIQLGEDDYFLMGDNRVGSYDSRKVGPFQRDEFRGKDIYVIYPFNEMKIVGNGAK